MRGGATRHLIRVFVGIPIILFRIVDRSPRIKHHRSLENAMERQQAMVEEIVLEMREARREQVATHLQMRAELKQVHDNVEQLALERWNHA